jgi:hypothetical protein
MAIGTLLFPMDSPLQTPLPPMLPRPVADSPMRTRAYARGIARCSPDMNDRCQRLFGMTWREKVAEVHLEFFPGRQNAEATMRGSVESTAPAGTTIALCVANARDIVKMTIIVLFDMVETEEEYEAMTPAEKEATEDRAARCKYYLKRLAAFDLNRLIAMAKHILHINPHIETVLELEFTLREVILAMLGAEARLHQWAMSPHAQATVNLSEELGHAKSLTERIVNYAHRQDQSHKKRSHDDAGEPGSAAATTTRARVEAEASDHGSGPVLGEDALSSPPGDTLGPA